MLLIWYENVNTIYIFSKFVYHFRCVIVVRVCVIFSRIEFVELCAEDNSSSLIKIIIDK